MGENIQTTYAHTHSCNNSKCNKKLNYVPTKTNTLVIMPCALSNMDQLICEILLHSTSSYLLDKQYCIGTVVQGFTKSCTYANATNFRYHPKSFFHPHYSIHPSIVQRIQLHVYSTRTESHLDINILMSIKRNVRCIPISLLFNYNFETNSANQSTSYFFFFTRNFHEYSI